MNLLFVSDVSISKIVGGAERVLYEQATRLQRKGYSVFNLTRMLSEHDSEKEIVDGVIEYRYDLNRHTPISYIFSTVRRGRKLLERLDKVYDFSCIHFHQPFSAYAVCRSPRARNIKKVYTCHSLSHEEYISRNAPPPGTILKKIYNLNVLARKWMEGQVLSRCDRVCVLSDFTRKKLLQKHRLDNERIMVIPGGVNTDRFYPAEDKFPIRRALEIPTERLIILTVRNLVSRMGLENLIRAFHRVRSKFKQAYLVIGGSGPLKSSLVEMTRQIGISKHVRFTGFIPEDRLPEYYRMADLFVLPTKELEGFGLVTLEAMASGVPVVGTPVGGTKEILGKFRPDLMFSDTSSEAMAFLIDKQCKKIAGDPEGWAELSRQCRIFVEKHYGWDRHIDALEALINQ